MWKNIYWSKSFPEPQIGRHCGCPTNDKWRKKLQTRCRSKKVMICFLARNPWSVTKSHIYLQATPNAQLYCHDPDKEEMITWIRTNLEIEGIREKCAKGNLPWASINRAYISRDRWCEGSTFQWFYPRKVKG